MEFLPLLLHSADGFQLQQGTINLLNNPNNNNKAAGKYFISE